MSNEICLWYLVAERDRSKITIKSIDGVAQYVVKDGECVTLNPNKPCYECDGLKRCEDYFVKKIECRGTNI